MIRVDLAQKFMLGDDAVLVEMDVAGVAALASALKDAAQQGSSQLEHGDVTHEFSTESGQSDIEIHGDRVVWKLDRAKVDEILDNLRALEAADRPGHQYVDISAPADTLVLSRDEYVKPKWNG